MRTSLRLKIKKPRAWLWVFVFAASLAHAEPSQLWDSGEWRSFGDELVSKDSLRLISVGAGFTAVSTAGDFGMRDNLQGSHMDSRTADFGDFLGTGIPGVAIALSQYGFDVAGADQHARALIATTIVTHSTKLLVGRKRPGTSPDRRSFPSGHTSTTFATATSLSMSYGWKAAVVAYPLAALTGASRIHDDAHWFSDVVGGAFVGIWVARASAKASERSAAEAHGQWIPWWSHESAGLAWTADF